ncbi:protein windpipe [Ceratina calcarata]|uniref:Protein windpipe n=1 Tax=Ceratina calcarata TaxID=156304 RepID=A0AAJ7J8F2_9HYME|nr:protein windpipe [Ceratina calcarata]XP_017886604.1 protein windpipe [Ceratina calcarata]
MQRTLPPLFLLLLINSGWVSGLCNLENSTTVYCRDLEDVKYIETYDLEVLKSHIGEPILHPGLFINLTTLRHLDLSGGTVEKIEPGSFKKLSNLRSLNLAENRIVHLELGSVDGLNRLHSLNLRKNNLQQLPPAVARLKILKHLNVEDNPLQCNCATLRVRDLILKRGVKISKKIMCAGPTNAKGTSIFKLDTATICQFEEQDREMQNDQASSNEDFGSGDEKGEESKEDVDVPDIRETSKDVEIETPFPQVEVSTVASELPESNSAMQKMVLSTESMDSTKKASDEEIFFDSEEKKTSTSTASAIKQKEFKDALFSPVDGSGDEEEGSGEGSGTIFGDWKKTGDVEPSEGTTEDDDSGTGLLDMFLNVFWTTTEPPKKQGDPDLEEEQFIDMTSTTQTEEAVPKKVDGLTESSGKGSTVSSANNVEIVNSEVDDLTTLGKVKVDEGEVSPSSDKQSKKGMGSYVVLVVLLAILATLIGFAAYKGDFCKKKRKRGDIENATELKDMQKSLLESGNSTQPKIASNGNVENVPLVGDAPNCEETKVANNYQVTADIPRSANGISDSAGPVKPPRAVTPQSDEKTQDRNSLKDDSFSGRTSSADQVDSPVVTRRTDVNEPPLSPGAQRVKITLQENPDSVPKTPILITKTMANENLYSWSREPTTVSRRLEGGEDRSELPPHGSVYPVKH